MKNKKRMMVEEDKVIPEVREEESSKIPIEEATNKITNKKNQRLNTNKKVGINSINQDPRQVLNSSQLQSSTDPPPNNKNPPPKSTGPPTPKSTDPRHKMTMMIMHTKTI